MMMMMMMMTMRLSLVPLLLLTFTTAFAPSFDHHHHLRCRTASSLPMVPPHESMASSEDPDAHPRDPVGTTCKQHAGTDRRHVLQTAMTAVASVAAGAVSSTMDSHPAWALDIPKTVVVAGATGQTGRRVLERLVLASSSNNNNGSLQVVGGVRNVAKAATALAESSTVVRGAMIQKVASVDASAVDLRHLDVEQDSIEQMKQTLQGADALIIAVGFVPGNPFQMSAAAHAVDNVGTMKLIDAAKQTGTVKKVVMVSSILTNGRAWGQEKAPGFVVTNAFGGVLDEKLVAEQHLRASGLDYTIVRPGGLKAKPPTGALVISAEDTLVAGEISRDLVAEVCVASLTDKKASNMVLEIVEDEGVPFKVFNGLVM